MVHSNADRFTNSHIRVYIICINCQDLNVPNFKCLTNEKHNKRHHTQQKRTAQMGRLKYGPRLIPHQSNGIAHSTDIGNIRNCRIFAQYSANRIRLYTKQYSQLNKIKKK